MMNRVKEAKGILESEAERMISKTQKAWEKAL